MVKRKPAVGAVDRWQVLWHGRDIKSNVWSRSSCSWPKDRFKERHPGGQYGRAHPPPMFEMTLDGPGRLQRWELWEDSRRILGLRGSLMAAS